MGDIIPYQARHVTHFEGQALARVDQLTTDLVRFAELVFTLRGRVPRKTFVVVTRIYSQTIEMACAVDNALQALSDCAELLLEETCEGEPVVFSASNDDETVQVSLDCERRGSAFRIRELDFHDASAGLVDRYRAQRVNR